MSLRNFILVVGIVALFVTPSNSAKTDMNELSKSLKIFKIHDTMEGEIRLA